MLAGTTLILMAIGAPLAAAEEPLFPFVISYDAPDNATNVSAWLPRPAGKHGFVRAEGGRLVTEAGPIRFWGTNLCFEACFPDRVQAERVAARLARLGTNCVRMHHMDMRSIWGDSPNKLTLDAKKLERLDYLIYQLKLHGVYTDLNLHVSRTLGPAEGFEAPAGRPEFDKGVGNFEPRMIELQKKYARDLLTHVNPYTQTPYSREPAVAFVEISNEDALFSVWEWRKLDELPDPYAATLGKLWNAWLRKKYGTTDKLRGAWNAGARPLGAEMLRNGDFTQPLAGIWQLERDDQTAADWAVTPDGPDGQRALRVVVARQGRESWRPQWWQGGLAVKKDSPYTLSFRLRSDQKRQIQVNCMMAHDPWQGLGFAASAQAGPQWQRFRFTFSVDHDDPDARITWTGLKPGTYELAEVSLRPGGIVGLAADQRLEDDSVPWLRRGEMNATRPARCDFVDFLCDTERDYWHGMYRFLKQELGVQPLVSGTQMGYGPASVQAGLDYIDAHNYWQHPHFPGRPWDPRNWTVHNVALVNTPGGTLADLASRRILGKAYTVSEYNHPAPNVYAAEGFPMIAAWGAFQRWDGIFPFAYCHNEDFEPRRITSFFDIKSDTAKLAHLPACAALFLRGDVEGARETLTAPLTPEAEKARLCDTLNSWQLHAGALGLDRRLSLLHAIALDLGPLKPTPRPPAQQPAVLPKDVGTFLADTGQLRWDVSQPASGYFRVDAPRAKLFTGFVRGRTFDLGDVRLRIGRTRLDWATVSMVAIDGEGFGQAGRILIAATGWQQNTGARLEQLPEDCVTLGDRWGDEPVLCEGIPAEIRLPAAADRVRLYPLDESGQRRPAVPCGSEAGKALLTLDPQHKTVWYEVQIR